MLNARGGRPTAHTQMLFDRVGSRSRPALLDRAVVLPRQTRCWLTVQLDRAAGPPHWGWSCPGSRSQPAALGWCVAARPGSPGRLGHRTTWRPGPGRLGSPGRPRDPAHRPQKTL